MQSHEEFLAQRRNYWNKNRTRFSKIRKAKHSSLTPEKKAEIALKYKAWRIKNIDVIKEKSKLQRIKHKDRITAYHIIYRKTRHKEIRDKDYRWRYGIGLTDIQKIREQQGNQCAICNYTFPFAPVKHTEKPYVDHNHITGKVRGLLCNSCNSILGWSKENINTLRNAIKYLEKEAENDSNQSTKEKCL